MTSNPVRPGQAAAPHGLSPGARGPAGPAERGIPAPRPPGPQLAFDLVLRGYDRHQVDARVAELVTRVGAVTEQLQATAAALAAERQRNGYVEHQLRVAQAAPAAPAPADDVDTGFGYRAERLLRLAEAEANEIRGTAIKEAAEIVEQAQAAAETHRHEIEQNLIMRATTLDQQANELAAALREREEIAAAELASARAEAEAVRVAARRDMEQARRNVETVSRDLRAQAERWAEQHRAAATSEVTRLTGLRDEMHRDLGTLSQNLLAAVRENPVREGEPDGQHALRDG